MRLLLLARRIRWRQAVNIRWTIFIVGPLLAYTWCPAATAQGVTPPNQGPESAFATSAAQVPQGSAAQIAPSAADSEPIGAALTKSLPVSTSPPRSAANKP